MSFLVSIFVFFTLYFYGRKKDRLPIPMKIVSGLVIAALSITLLWSDVSPVIGRLHRIIEYSETIELDYRSHTYAATWEMSKDFPWLGIGLGAFEFLFFKYRGAEVAATATTAYSSTHNDYLELLADTGRFGFVFVMVYLMLFFVMILWKLKDRRDPFLRSLAAGGIGGLVSMLCHSFVDFNMQIPANALHFFVVMGIVQAAVSSES